jgi:hypothetical protein
MFLHPLHRRTARRHNAGRSLGPLGSATQRHSAILLDQNARNFDPIDDQIDIANNGPCDDVQPGFKQTVTLAFQMPKDSNTTELVLWNDAAEDDFDGSQSDVRVTK